MPDSLPHPSTPLGQGVDHYENFPVASLLCPPRLRPAIAAIYGFARTADDIADEGDAQPEQRLADLAQFRVDLAAAVNGTGGSYRWSTVFTPLGRAIAQFRLPVDLLTDLISAFEQDVVKTRYADQAELDAYCRWSANPVGRLLLHLYGVDDAQALAESDAICTALQLINFWQDLKVDLARGRIYLPADAQARHGVSDKELLALTITHSSVQLIAEQVAHARALMVAGSPLVHKIPGRGGWELRLVVQGGLRILDKIEALEFNTLEHRPTLSKYDVAVMAWRAVTMR